jgi:hypothetical protein
MKLKKPNYTRMNTDQLAQATSELDREMVVDDFKAPSKKDRDRWEKARRKPGAHGVAVE